MRLSDFSQRIDGQPMFKLMAKAQKIPNMIHFELGDPDFDTPKNIVNATIKALKEGKTHYCNSTGLAWLKTAIRDTTLKTRHFSPNLNQILVTPGANIIIYFTMQCLMNLGDEVLLPDPGFPTYFSVAKMLNLKIKHIQLKEENSFRLNPRDVFNNITSKTRLIVINSPSNPTGAVMTKDEITEIYNIARKRHIFILSDEIYSRMLYGGTEFYSPSMIDYCRKYIIVLNGFSKAFAMTGWRLGVTLGPEKLIEKMGLLLQTLCSCVSPFIQEGGIAAIQGNQKTVNKMMDIYSVRREFLFWSLKGLPNINIVKPQGGFYMFPNITKTGMTSQEFSNFAFKHGVALLPGTNFGKYGEGYVRLTFTNKCKNLREGIRRLDDGLRLHH